MYSMKSKAIATGVIALSLLAASPVFADSNKGEDNGLHLGLFAKILHEDRKDDGQDRREERKADRQDERENHAVSGATTTRPFMVEGMVTAINGATLTVQGSHGAVYSVNSVNASFVGHHNAAITLGSIKVHDKVAVTGTLSGSTITATKVKDTSDQTGKIARSFTAGIVTGINGSLVTIGNFGSTGTSTFVTNSATKFKVNGSAASSSALTLGSHVVVLGTTTAGSGTVNASVIVILTEGLNWIRHFWN